MPSAAVTDKILILDYGSQITQLIGFYAELLPFNTPIAEIRSHNPKAIIFSDSPTSVMGDGRTYDNVLALRAITSVDGMTADDAPLPHEFLGRMAVRIVNEVKGINRVVYDITSKPSWTIEWE